MARSLEYTPGLQFSLNGTEITLEENPIHNPAVEESLRNDPKQLPEIFSFKAESNDADTGIDK